MPQPNNADFRPPAPRRHWGLWFIALLIVLGAGWWYLGQAAHEQAPTETAASAPRSAPASASSEEAAAGAATPESEGATASGVVTSENAEPPADTANGMSPRNPMDVLGAPDADLPSVNASDARVKQGLNEVVGAKHVAEFLVPEGFVRRFVATVDNLGRPFAAARLWPVRPAPGRFTVADAAATDTMIAPANAVRYRAFVAFAQSVPLGATVSLYAHLYPLFQTAYEELGYPGRYFNDRLVAVLNLLISTPIPNEPVAVELTRVNGKLPTAQPWVRYEYADPKLQALTSGQKMLIRMGPDNARTLKAVMTALRDRVATGAIAQPKSAR